MLNQICNSQAPRKRGRSRNSRLPCINPAPPHVQRPTMRKDTPLAQEQPRLQKRLPTKPEGARDEMGACVDDGEGACWSRCVNECAVRAGLPFVLGPHRHKPQRAARIRRRAGPDPWGPQRTPRPNDSGSIAKAPSTARKQRSAVVAPGRRRFTRVANYVRRAA